MLTRGYRRNRRCCSVICAVGAARQEFNYLNFGELAASIHFLNKLAPQGWATGLYWAEAGNTCSILPPAALCHPGSLLEPFVNPMIFFLFSLMWDSKTSKYRNTAEVAFGLLCQRFILIVLFSWKHHTINVLFIIPTFYFLFYLCMLLWLYIKINSK